VVGTLKTKEKSKYSIVVSPYELEANVVETLAVHCEREHRIEYVWQALPATGTTPAIFHVPPEDVFLFRLLRKAAQEEPLPGMNKLNNKSLALVGIKRIALAKWFLRHTSEEFLRQAPVEHNALKTKMYAWEVLQRLEHKFGNGIESIDFLFRHKFTRLVNRFQLIFFQCSIYRTLLYSKVSQQQASNKKLTVMVPLQGAKASPDSRSPRVKPGQRITEHNLLRKPA
jgi:hypothetical protein